MVFVSLSVKYRDFQWFLSHSQLSMETSNGFSLSKVWKLPIVFVLLSVKYGNPCGLELLFTSSQKWG